MSLGSEQLHHHISLSRNSGRGEQNSFEAVGFLVVVVFNGCQYNLIRLLWAPQKLHVPVALPTVLPCRWLSLSRLILSLWTFQMCSFCNKHYSLNWKILFKYWYSSFSQYFLSLVGDGKKKTPASFGRIKAFGFCIPNLIELLLLL